MGMNTAQGQISAPTASKEMPSGARGPFLWLKRIPSTVRYSIAGFREGWSETSVREEVVLGLVHFSALFCLPISWTARAILAIVWVLLVCVELLNTAIETVVDMVSPNWNPLAKRAKDLGSAAVFCMVVVLIIGWLLVLCSLLNRYI